MDSHVGFHTTLQRCWLKALIGCRPAEPGTAAAFEATLAQSPCASRHLTSLLQGLAHQAAAEVAAGQELRAAMASKGTGPGAIDGLEQAIASAAGFFHLQVKPPPPPPPPGGGGRAAAH